MLQSLVFELALTSFVLTPLIKLPERAFAFRSIFHSIDTPQIKRVTKSGSGIEAVASHINTMHQLPPELWAWVCSLSDIRSLKKIRLVNSTLCHIAARHLFDGLYVTLIPKYLYKVMEVASHPTLRSYVRTLYFDYNILDEDYEDYELWKKAIKHQFDYYDRQPGAKGQLPNPARCSQSDLDRFHANFCSLRASQNACFDRQRDLAMLSATFALLPHMRTIKAMDTASRYRPPLLLSDLQKDTFLVAPFVFPSSSTQSDISRPLASLLSGLGLTRKRILSMELGQIAWSFWEDNGPSGFLHDAERLTHAAFQHLESMNVCFVVDLDDLQVRLQGSLPPSITRFVGSAPRLRQLELSFVPRDNGGGGGGGETEFDGRNRLPVHCPRAGQLFAALTLSNLAIFHLQGCTLTENILKHFITKHSTTLKEVCMDAVVLDNRSEESTSWEKTLRHIAPILFLDSAALFSLSSDDIESVVLAGDPDLVARHNRSIAYCQALTIFFLRRGRTECPRIVDFARP